MSHAKHRNASQPVIRLDPAKKVAAVDTGETVTGNPWVPRQRLHTLRSRNFLLREDRKIASGNDIGSIE
jgi:hypothetical protein